MIRLRLIQLNNPQAYPYQTGHVVISNMAQPPPNYTDAMSNKLGAPNPNYNKY
jgi:hypothetical protein